MVNGMVSRLRQRSRIEDKIRKAVPAFVTT